MKNFIQSGNVITFTAPTGGITSGSGLLAGSLFGVASTDAAQGTPVECSMTGVFELPKAADDVEFGEALYWDDTEKEVTVTALDNTLIGAAVAAAAAGVATVRVRLNGSA